MKKDNENLDKGIIRDAGTKVTIGTVLSSIILQSCTFDTEWYNNKDNIYGDISLSPTDKVDLLNIGQLRLSKTLVEY